MHQLARIACALMGAGSAWAAVPGVPESPRPGLIPDFWLAWGNDMLGGEFGENTDNFRTNSFTLGLHHDGWIVGIDHAIFTDRFAALPRRCDQLTVTAGYGVESSLWGPDRTWLAAGIGARVTADVGGSAMQTAWHQRNGFPVYHLQPDATATEALAWSQGSWFVPFAVLGMDGATGARLGLDLEASGLTTTGGEWLGDVGVGIAVVGADAHATIGIRAYQASGSPPNATARAVAEHEDGTWFTYGMGAGGWFFAGAFQLDGPGTYGAVGWEFGRDHPRRPAMVGQVDGAFALYQGYAMGLQYRWQPEWIAELSARHLSIYVDYRFGRHPGPELDGANSLVMRQGSAGIDFVPYTARTSWCSVAPFVQVGSGVREERIQINGYNPRFPEQRAIRPVLTSTVGMRVLFGGAADNDINAYGFSLVYDSWLPLSEATAVNQFTNDHAEYQSAGSAFGIRFNASVAW